MWIVIGFIMLLGMVLLPASTVSDSACAVTNPPKYEYSREAMAALADSDRLPLPDPWVNLLWDNRFQLMQSLRERPAD